MVSNTGPSKKPDTLCIDPETKLVRFHTHINSYILSCDITLWNIQNIAVFSIVNYLDIWTILTVFWRFCTFLKIAIILCR